MNASDLEATVNRDQGQGARKTGRTGSRDREPDPWSLLRLLTLVVLVIFCGLMVVTAADFMAPENRWVNLGLMAGGLVTGLLCVFLPVRKSDARYVSTKRNALAGLLSLLFLGCLIVLNPNGVPSVGKNVDWAAVIVAYLQPIGSALLLFLYLELLWGLVSFQKEVLPRADHHNRFYYLQRLNVRHYLAYLAVLAGSCAGFILAVAVMTTRSLATSPTIFLHSLAAGTPYPYFMVGMLGLSILLVILGVQYLRYRWLRAGLRTMEAEE